MGVGGGGRWTRARFGWCWRLTRRRNRLAEAIGLGLASLRELGIAVPDPDRLPMELDRQFTYLYRWLDHTDGAGELTRPEITEPTLLAATRLINAVLPAAYFAGDQRMQAWLSLEALRIWIEHGPARTLLGPAAHTAFAAVEMLDDYTAGYRVVRRLLALGEARGYEPDTSQVRFLSALLNCWFEPIENIVQAARRAREGLIAGGDLANALHTYYPTVTALLDCAPSLDVYVAEVEAGLAFVRRTGGEQTGESLDSYQRVADELRGERSTAAGGAADADRYPDSPVLLLHAHVARAVAAAAFGDLVGLTRHSIAAMPLLSAAPGLYSTAVAHVLRGLAFAGQARAGHGDERGGLLCELDEELRWLAARAADAPVNFLHLLRLLEAERAWAVGDFRAAILAFDAALREVAGRQRPWHRALITEHAARFHLAHGVERAGYSLLAEARQEYLEWGATAKVDQLDWAYPTLRPQGGDLQNACFSYYVDLPQRLEYEQSLDNYVVEVESALTFALRTGNEQSAQAYRNYRRLVATLRGEPDARAVDQEEQELADNPTAAANMHLTRGLAALLFGDREGLARHSAAAMSVLPFVEATYPTFTAHFLRAMALSDRVRSSAGDEGAEVLAELDQMIDWMASRSEDAPGNFQHLLSLVEAERAWAMGDFLGACRAFDAAQREVRGLRRPWHQALILERCARFLLTYGIDHGGNKLLGDARRAYEIWGATAKVADLDRNHPLLWSRSRPPRGPAHPRAANTTTGAIDVLGILEASRALSSETSLDGLRARVVDVLSAMTGATTVHIVLRDEEKRGWLLRTPAGDAGIPVDRPESQRLVPQSALRYAERTREPLMVADATRDDRFARDPYFAGLDCCSLLVVPILNRGTLQALLLLENRLIRGAFSADRLDGVMMIAGQLAVSLDNTLVYASLERKVAERTKALGVANERLEVLSVTDPLTGLANRRRFEEVLDTQWGRARRSGQSIGLAMADIDHFKLYNDHYGHPAGDECLRRVAAAVNRSIREIDLATRYGGEEFAIVMPDTDIRAAHQVAQRILVAIEALAEPHPLAAKRIVTVSIGVAAVRPSGPTTHEELVELADIALYRAKRNGRDRVQASQHIRSTTAEDRRVD